MENICGVVPTNAANYSTLGTGKWGTFRRQNKENGLQRERLHSTLHLMPRVNCGQVLQAQRLCEMSLSGASVWGRAGLTGHSALHHPGHGKWSQVVSADSFPPRFVCVVHEPYSSGVFMTSLKIYEIWWQGNKWFKTSLLSAQFWKLFLNFKN
jgi:hypothetical protein